MPEYLNTVQYFVTEEAMSTTQPTTRKSVTTTDLALIATFAALIAVCSVAAALHHRRSTVSR